MGEGEETSITRMTTFQELVRSRRAFIIPAASFFLVFYFALPVLIAFTSVLDAKVIGAVSLAYVYAFALFAMTLVLSHLYLSKAKRWDELVEQTKREAAKKEIKT